MVSDAKSEVGNVLAVSVGREYDCLIRMPAGLDLYLRASFPATRDATSTAEYFRSYQRNGILSKITVGQIAALGILSTTYTKPNYSTILYVLPRPTEPPLHRSLLMSLHIYNAAATEATSSVDVFQRSTTRRDA
jgi:hypothetical protein